MNSYLFDRPAFLTNVKKAFGRLTPEQIDGLAFLIGKIEADKRWTRVEQIAYFLGTVWHETARAMVPVVEHGSPHYFEKYEGRKSLGNALAGDGYKFRGRGYVQNTGRNNATLAGIALKGLLVATPTFVGTVGPSTFTEHPEVLLDRNVSYADAVAGMFTGRYTGKKITDYINADKCDYVNARRVINGLDRAGEIAQHAKKFEVALRDSAMLGEPAKSEIKVEVPVGKSEDAIVEDNLTIEDIKQYVTADTAKSLALKAGWKVSAGLGGAWAMGWRTQTILILVGVLALVVCSYEVRRHWKQAKALAISALKGGLK